MVVPILSTKLYIPPLRSRYVNRSILIKRLNDRLESGNKLTLISAPAGFGKTTLISEWASACGRPVAWLSLDESDSTPTGFLLYMIGALQTIKPGLGEEVANVLQSPQSPDFETLLIILLNELVADDTSFMLVLDDYQVIDSKEVDQMLAFLVEHQPRQMHLVIASREDPPLPLPRLRAKNQLTELRAADLRFTQAEAADFLNRVMALELSTDDISTLDAQIEGWAAGLQLAALSMQGQKDARLFIRSFTGSHHYVLDYLLNEVLHQQPEVLQTFLLKTSILDHLCGPLCEAVMDDPTAHGQATLEALERSNLFIVPFDDERKWFRYHPLFRDLLQNRLGQCLPMEEINLSHLRASQWYQSNGNPARAFHHALTARNFTYAAELAENTYREMDDRFQSAVWLDWVKKLPDAVLNNHPLLCTQIGTAYTDAGETETSESYLRMADQYLEKAGENAQDQSLPAMVTLAHASNAQLFGETQAAVKYAALALQLTPEDNIFLRAQAEVTLGFSNWANGDLESALKVMQDWMASMQKTGNLVFVVASAFALADILIALGRLGDAEVSLKGSIDLASIQVEEAEKITAHHYLGLAMIAHERYDAESFLVNYQRAQELGEKTSLVDWPYRKALAQALIKESEGNLEEALILLDEAKKRYVKNPIPDLRSVEALKARIYLKQGLLGKAQPWSQRRGCSTSDEINFLNEFDLLTLARLRIAEGQYSEINEMLERLLKAAKAQQRMGSVLEILVTQSLSSAAQGDSSQAIHALEQALALAEPEGYLRLFVNEGQPMLLLLEKLSRDRNHPSRDYIDRLIASFSPSAKKAATASVPSHHVKLIEPLTERELEILRLVAQGLSNSDISKKLFVAVSTIKGHNLRIFDKLQAQNRTEAVATAREMGLL